MMVRLKADTTKNRLTCHLVDSRDFGGGAQAALDGAVHVALPLDAGVLAGEEQAAGRTRQPGAQRGIEAWIEEGVAAARVRILFPHELARRDQFGVIGAEPVERVDEPARALPRDDRLGGVAGAALRCRPTTPRTAAANRRRAAGRAGARNVSRTGAASSWRGRT